MEVGLAIENQSHVGVYCSDDDGTVIHHFDQEGIHKHRIEDWDGQLRMGECLYMIPRGDLQRVVSSVNSQFGAYSPGAKLPL